MALTPATFYGYIWTSCLLLAALLTIWVIKMSRYVLNKERKSRNIPGSVFEFLFRPSTDILEKLTFLVKKHSGLLKAWAGLKLVYVTSKAEIVHEICNNPNSLNTPFTTRFLSELTEGLLVLSGERWKLHRKLILPSFNRISLNSFVPTFNEQAVILGDIMERHVNVGNFDFQTLTVRYAMECICQTAIGVKMDIQNSNKDLAEMFDKVLKCVAHRGNNIFYHNDLIWRLSPIGKLYNTYAKQLLGILFEIIEKKLAAKESAEKSKIPSEEEDRFKRLSMFDLVYNRHDFTEKEIKEEISTILVAGTHTIGTTICNIALILGLYPDIQNKVYEEVMGVLGMNEVHAELLSKLQYTEMVIRETLRFFPAAPIIGRSITKDIKVGNVTLCEDSMIYIVISDIHRNSEYWEEPLKFDPDRFLPEKIAERKPGIYLPFSTGPRTCIGYQYSIYAMKTVIANLIRRFKFYTGYGSIEEVIIKFNVTLKVNDGYKLRIEKRDNIVNIGK